MNPHLIKLIEEYGELKKREGILETEIYHHVSMFTTLKEEVSIEKPKIKIPAVKRQNKSTGLTDFLREWIKANNLDPDAIKPSDLFDAASRQFPDITKTRIGSCLQNIRKSKK